MQNVFIAQLLTTPAEVPNNALNGALSRVKPDPENIEMYDIALTIETKACELIAELRGTGRHPA